MENEILKMEICKKNNIINNVEVEYKLNIRDKIESLTELQQQEVFRIFRNSDTEFSENKNGIFINLINIDTSILQEVDDYIKHLSIVENEINNIEQQKQEIKHLLKNDILE